MKRKLLRNSTVDKKGSFEQALMQRAESKRAPRGSTNTRHTTGPVADEGASPLPPIRFSDVMLSPIY